MGDLLRFCRDLWWRVTGVCYGCGERGTLRHCPICGEGYCVNNGHGPTCDCASHTTTPPTGEGEEE